MPEQPGAFLLRQAVLVLVLVPGGGLGRLGGHLHLPVGGGGDCEHDVDVQVEQVRHRVEDLRGDLRWIMTSLMSWAIRSCSSVRYRVSSEAAPPSIGASLLLAEGPRKALAARGRARDGSQARRRRGRRCPLLRPSRPRGTAGLRD